MPRNRTRGSTGEETPEPEREAGAADPIAEIIRSAASIPPETEEKEEDEDAPTGGAGREGESSSRERNTDQSPDPQTADTLHMYLNEINRIKLLDREEERSIAARIETAGRIAETRKKFAQTKRRPPPPQPEKQCEPSSRTWRERRPWPGRYARTSASEEKSRSPP